MGCPFTAKKTMLITAAISRRTMDEKFQAKMLIHNMAANEQNMMMRGNAFFCILPIIS